MAGDILCQIEESRFVDEISANLISNPLGLLDDDSSTDSLFDVNFDAFETDIRKRNFQPMSSIMSLLLCQ